MFRKSRSVSLAAALVALGAAGCTAGAGEVASSGDAVSCEIETGTSGGTVTLQAVVRAAAPVTGTYRFEVKSSGAGGRTNVSQGGAFNAGPGDEARLGQLMLGSQGASYDVRLEVEAGGRTYDCAQRI